MHCKTTVRLTKKEKAEVPSYPIAHQIPQLNNKGTCNIGICCIETFLDAVFIAANLTKTKYQVMGKKDYFFHDNQIYFNHILPNKIPLILETHLI